jgi:ABC-type branched-subunit amino acid transport system substrate-binding protein
MTLISQQQRNLARGRTAMTFGSIALACGMALAAPAVAAPSDKAVVVRTLAGRVGSIVGAASSCQNIARTRIQTVIDKFSSVINEAAATEPERVNIGQLLDRSISDGRRALSNAQTDCSSTERQFADLEQSIGVGAVSDASPAPAVLPAPSAPVTQTAAIASPSTVGVRGVTDHEIRFGMAGSFSGAAKELGREMKLGIDAAFSRANEAGGVNGRTLRLIAVDDGYEPAQTKVAMAQLYDKDQVFGIIGNVGATTAEVALPYALDRRMLFFGAFTGAPILRRDPPDRYVFNYRASFAEETEAAVHYLVKVRGIAPRDIAVFAQNDAGGDAGYAGVIKAMRTLGVNERGFLHLSYKRNTVDIEDALTQLRARKGTIKGVVMIAAYRAAAKFIEKTHDAYPDMIHANISFVGSTELADELKLLGPRYTKGVVVTQVVPAVDSYSSAILEYKAALTKYFPGEALDYVSLEGYVAGNILVQALKQAGPQLDTEKLVDSLESIRGLDMGLGTTLNFGRTEHQASHKVWGTMLDQNGRYQAIDLE